jgi:7,8-didemethyl-8-hydroxy-5-deazariboflavin synthase CofG subunit
LLQPHFLGAKLLLTTVDNTVAQEGALSKAPTHAPEYRLQSIIDVGDAGIPLTTGIMIGIGESRESRGKAIRVLAQVASRYGHIRSVLIQAFRPHPATPMAHHKPASLEEMLETVALARRHLPPFVRVQINALDWGGHLPELVRAGADDLGDLSLKVLSSRGRDPQMELALLLEPLKAKGYAWRIRSMPAGPGAVAAGVPQTA